MATASTTSADDIKYAGFTRFELELEVCAPLRCHYLERTLTKPHLLCRKVCPMSWESLVHELPGYAEAL